MRFLLSLLKQALVNMKSNRAAHLIGLGTMVVSLLIFGMFLLFLFNLDAWLKGWGQSHSVSVYLMDDIAPDQRQKIADFVEQRNDLEIERYISKEEAFEALKRDMGSHAGLLEGLTKNPLPASFELRALHVGDDMEALKHIKQSLESLEGVAEAQYSEEWRGRLKGFIGVVRLVGFVMGGLLCLGVLFIVTNTIKLTIYTRKEEVNVLLMVGATDGFIKTPFILEGMIQGALSGAVSITLLYLGYLSVSSKGFALFEAAAFRFAFIPMEYVLSLFVASIGLGFLGSYIAVGRFYDI